MLWVTFMASHLLTISPIALRTNTASLASFYSKQTTDLNRHEVWSCSHDSIICDYARHGYFARRRGSHSKNVPLLSKSQCPRSSRSNSELQRAFWTRPHILRPSKHPSFHWGRYHKPATCGIQPCIQFFAMGGKPESLLASKYLPSHRREWTESLQSRQPVGDQPLLSLEHGHASSNG